MTSEKEYLKLKIDLQGNLLYFGSGLSILYIFVFRYHGDIPSLFVWSSLISLAIYHCNLSCSFRGQHEWLLLGSESVDESFIWVLLVCYWNVQISNQRWVKLPKNWKGYSLLLMQSYVVKSP